MTKEDFLLMLVRSELWGVPVKAFDMRGAAWRSLMALAEKETVAGLLCESLTRCCRLRKQDAAATYAALGDIGLLNRKADAAVAALATLLGRHGIRYLVVKGQTLAALYPHPRARMAGDIDFYVWPDDFSRARRAIEQAWHVEMEDDADGGLHLSFEHEGNYFEMHYRLLCFASRSVQRRFDRLVDGAETVSVTVGGHGVATLEPVMNVVYTFLHLYRHLMELGVGLRQLCDLTLLLDHYRRVRREGDDERLRLTLDALGFRRAFCAVGWLCMDRLGLEWFPLAIPEADKRYADAILSIVFRRGNFGQFGRREAVRSGWRYCFEQLGIKLRHYRLLFPLAPREAGAAVARGIPARVVAAFKREKKKCCARLGLPESGRGMQSHASCVNIRALEGL